MARYKMTVGYLLGAIGASESFISPDNTAANVSNNFQLLLNKRLDLIHESVNITGVRFALLDPAQKRRSAFYGPGTFYPINKRAADGSGGTAVTIPATGQSSTLGHRPDQARAALLVRQTYDTDRNAPLYLFAPPDAVLQQEPMSFNPAGSPSWNVSFSDFRSYVIANGWSVRARSRSGGFTPLPILRWVTATTTPAYMGAVVSATTGAPFGIADVIQVLNTRRKGTDKTTYNGRYIVYDVVPGPGTSQYTIFLKDTETGDATSIKRLGQIQKIGTDYFPILDLEPLKASTHKRGRPFGSPQGKRLTRVSLDF